MKNERGFTLSIDLPRKISGVWIPTARRVIEAEGGKITTRILTLRNPRLRAR